MGGLFVFSVPALGQSGGAASDRETVAVRIGTKTIRAVLANTDATRMEGLLEWETISDETGMLLDFVEEKESAIHMNGMKFPIDAVWIDHKGTIKLIYEEIPPNPVHFYPSMFKCRYCLELKAGFCKRYGVKIGQTVQFGGTR
jgi:uncharacterized protein